MILAICQKNSVCDYVQNLPLLQLNTKRKCRNSAMHVIAQLFVLLQLTTKVRILTAQASWVHIHKTWSVYDGILQKRFSFLLFSCSCITCKIANDSRWQVSQTLSVGDRHSSLIPWPFFQLRAYSSQSQAVALNHVGSRPGCCLYPQPKHRTAWVASHLPTPEGWKAKLTRSADW